MLDPTIDARLIDRRRVNLSEPLPGIQVLLRQLHLRVLDLETARVALAEFRLRLGVASEVTREMGQTESAAHLAQAERKLTEIDRGGASPTRGDADEIKASIANALSAFR